MIDEPIAVVPYEPEWPHLFEAERSLLESLLRPLLDKGIHHVGSTTIPGLAAKPIIDMIAGVSGSPFVTPCGTTPHWLRSTKH